MLANGIGYVEYNIQSDSSKWLLSLLKRSSITTVPQVFNDKGTHIGGYTELKEYLS
jgi:glutaredoxin